MNLWFNDDLFQRIYILGNTAILVVYGNNAPFVDTDIVYMRLSVSVYLIVHANISLISLFYSLSSHRYRRQMRLWATLIAISSSFWFPLLSDKVPIHTKVALAVSGLVFEECSWASCTSPLSARLLGSDHEVAMYSIHEQEHYTSIYILGLAQFVFRLIVGSPLTGINHRLPLAIWTLLIAFGLNWMYAHADGSLRPRHPLTYSFSAVMQWLLLRNPLLASLIAGGQVTVAGSTTLSEGAKSSLGHNGSNGSDEFTMEHSWLSCGSLSLSVFMLYYFAQLAGSMETDGMLLFPKQVRLIMRPIIGLVLLFLPCAHDRLSFLTTLSIIMGLIIFCVMWEVATSLQRGVKICEPWTES